MQELFGALTCGGMLLLATPGGEKDTQYMARLCLKERVSCMVLVPAALEVLLQVRCRPSLTAFYWCSTGRAARNHLAVSLHKQVQFMQAQEPDMAHCESMRHIVAGGEALTPALAARVRQRLPRAHLHNTYGPTEATIDITGGRLGFINHGTGRFCTRVHLPRLSGASKAGLNQDCHSKST